MSEIYVTLLFTVHGAINMHFILIQLYFVLNARSRMNYNHLEGGRALNNNYRENYGGSGGERERGARARFYYHK